MTVYMDPDSVADYSDHLTARLDELTVQSSLLATEAPAVAGVDDTESGLLPPLEFFGPDALWSDDVQAAIETVYFNRAGEAATAAQLVGDLQQTLRLFVERWHADEDAIVAEMDALTAELENWRA